MASRRRFRVKDSRYTVIVYPHCAAGDHMRRPCLDAWLIRDVSSMATPALSGLLTALSEASLCDLSRCLEESIERRGPTARGVLPPKDGLDLSRRLGTRQRPKTHTGRAQQAD